MSQPDWFRIIKAYPDNTNGPTIPFLVGALRQNFDSPVPEDKSKDELVALIQAMRNEMPTGYGVQIKMRPAGRPCFGFLLGGGLRFKDMYPPGFMTTNL